MAAVDGVLTQRSGSVLELTISREQNQNSLDASAMAELDRRIAEAAADTKVRVLVIRGAGEKAFSAGADLRELTRADAAAAARILKAGQRVFRSLETLGKPAIAAVDGYALGGGFELCLAASLIIATDRSRFGLPEVGLGLIPGYGGTQRLTRAIGKHRALRIMLTGDLIDARGAHEIGILSLPPVPVAEFDDRVRELAEQLAVRSPRAMESILDGVDASQQDGLAHGLRLESRLAIDARASADGLEGVAAFFEKRSPSFAGIDTSDRPDTVGTDAGGST